MSRSAKPEFSLASQVDPELAEEELEAEGILAINNDYKYTADRYVALAIEKPENDKIIKMRFRNQGGEWSDWQDYAPFKIWTLEGAMGVKQVDSEYLLASGQTIKAEDKIIYGKAYDYNLEVYSGDLNLGALKSAKKYSSNAELELNFKIKNLGYKTWKSTGDNSVRISYHIWQRNQDGTKGELLYWDNTHFFLSNNLELGEATNYSASLLLPHEQGEYIIEFDLVEELVTWFAHEGVSTIKVPVDLE
jgi:hypothetical protein